MKITDVKDEELERMLIDATRYQNRLNEQLTDTTKALESNGDFIEILQEEKGRRAK